ncbi:hypothetical protein GGR26_001235 [Lewinella marina]|uniref:Outer membrane protein beta-barrel domain-containing protein n=1 Tax=Neolewinella marina TaxID=438751 RepID=A0A2G0CFX3_9BACT|nr:hypothetical protein [Neolewinella marina]NJB85490.1 hypothetical protein [Neolewinella marina]PHK98820.1 hypothetical protein CGL56_10180 [Neolewinella marina]
MKTLYTLFFLLFAVGLSAQDVAYASTAVAPAYAYRTSAAPALATKDYSLRREKTLLGDLDLSGAWGGPTYNYSATGDDWSLVRGGFGGLEFGNNVFLGYGGWKARESFTTDEAPLIGSRPEYDFRHGGFIIGVTPGADNVIHPRFTAIVGPGRIDVANEGRDRMLVGQLMGGAELNLFQWFRLGIEGGYRFASGVDSQVVTAKDVSGAVVQIEARFGWSW